MLGTTGMPLRTKTCSIFFAMARFRSYISAVVRGCRRSLSCLAGARQTAHRGSLLTNVHGTSHYLLSLRDRRKQSKHTRAEDFTARG